MAAKRTKKKPIKLVDPWGFDDLMVMAAFRYCLGRRTYVVGCCVDWLIDNWKHFSEGVRDLITRELRDALDDDERSRMNSEDTCYPLGDDCDRVEWTRLAAAIFRYETRDEENPA
jgi:hypothetical protein